MTRSAQPMVRVNFEVCLGIIRQAAVEILMLLNIHAAEGKDPRWFLEQLEVARLNLGNWAAVARRLNLNDAEMSQFTIQLRHLQQQVPGYESGQDVSTNQMIAALRFVSALEQLKEKQPLLHYSTALDTSTPAPEREARQQIRALELMIRGLIHRAWPDRSQLLHHLNTLFGADKVRRWVKMSENDDVLSGMLFSELALLLVDKKEYARHYASIFQSAASLSFLIEPRKTLQAFLEDVRQYRNTLLSGQPLTPTQSTLLDSYFEDISSPVQRAYNEGRTSVNPGALLAANESELAEFYDYARQKNDLVGGDIFDVRSGIDRPEKMNARSKEERQQLIYGALWGVVGIVVITIAIGALMIVSDVATPPAPAAQKNILSEEVDEQRYTSTRSARDVLASMGIRWDENSLRSAIERNDSKVARLFLQGGMEWKVSWTEQLLADESNETLNLLLNYRPQMNELKPCRRMIATIGHAMAQGESLNALRKQYLRAFCTTPAVVKRQKYEMELAQQREVGGGDIEKKWAGIQKAIYRVIE